MMINTYQPEDGERQSSIRRRTKLLTSLRRQSRLRMRSDTTENIRVNGIAGKSVDSSENSPRRTRADVRAERDWLVALMRKDGTLL